MRNVALSTTLLAFVTLQMSGCGNPMGPIPGGKLEGESKAWEDDWSFTANVENVLLETNPENPYSVTLWGVTIGDNFYVAGVNGDSRWVEHIAKHSYVVLSVSGALYQASATVVTDNDEKAEIWQAYIAKYGIDASEQEDNFIEKDGVVFRLTPR